jgi:hypothetical protein
MYYKYLPVLKVRTLESNTLNDVVEWFCSRDIHAIRHKFDETIMIALTRGVSVQATSMRDQMELARAYIFDPNALEGGDMQYLISLFWIAFYCQR